MKFTNMLRGVGSVIELFPTLRPNVHKIYRPSSSDAEALRRDMSKVGQDLWRALGSEEKALKKG